MEMINTHPDNRPDFTSLIARLDIIWDEYLKTQDVSETSAPDNDQPSNGNVESRDDVQGNVTSWVASLDQISPDLLALALPPPTIPDQALSMPILDSPRLDLSPVQQLASLASSATLHQPPAETISLTASQREELQQLIIECESALDPHQFTHNDKKLKEDPEQTRSTPIVSSYNSQTDSHFSPASGVGSLIQKLKVLCQKEETSVKDIVQAGRALISVVLAEYGMKPHFAESRTSQLCGQLDKTLSALLEKSPAYQQNQSRSENNTKETP